jgi:hypothetical protein
VRVIILCGLPGVGKLTVAKGLARLRGYRVFHNHLVFDTVEALFPFGSAAFIELRERLWFDLLSRAVCEGVGNIVFTIARDQSLGADFLTSSGAFPRFTMPTDAIVVDTTGLSAAAAVAIIDARNDRTQSAI